MNFKQLPKDKRNHLVLVALITATALGALGFGLIRFQYDNLKRIAAETTEAEKKLDQMKRGNQRAEQIEAELAEERRSLSLQEEGMATGNDTYSWVFDMIRRFTISYKVEIPVVNQPVPGECTLLPRFPYKQASLSLSGTGYFHEIGRFIADFENQYPHIRVLSLTLDPVSGLISDDREKLEFKMDIVVLVRPNQS